MVQVLFGGGFKVLDMGEGVDGCIIYGFIGDDGEYVLVLCGGVLFVCVFGVVVDLVVYGDMCCYGVLCDFVECISGGDMFNECGGIVGVEGGLCQCIEEMFGEDVDEVVIKGGSQSGNDV